MSVVLPLPQDLASRVHSCPLRRGGNRFRKMEDHGHHGPHGRRVERRSARLEKMPTEQNRLRAA